MEFQCYHKENKTCLARCIHSIFQLNTYSAPDVRLLFWNFATSGSYLR